MKAIVLTYDKYRVLTEHMIFKYECIWPNHPFRFRIPYQTLKGNNDFRHEYILCPSDIKGTVLELLSDLDDEEWIYWCIDDKYPFIFDLQKILQITKWIVEDNPSDVSGVSFCRSGSLLHSENLTGKKIRDSHGNIYLGRKNYRQIWVHQFLRVKVLRYFFEQLPDSIPNAKTMDKLKMKVILPQSHRLLVTQNNFAMFGESTTKGKLTLNCYQSLMENHLPLPESIALDEKKIMYIGKMNGTSFYNNLKRFAKRRLNHIKNRIKRKLRTL